jgi:hypothetical protein
MKSLNGVVSSQPGIQLPADDMKHRKISTTARSKDPEDSILSPKQVSSKVSCARLGN